MTSRTYETPGACGSEAVSPARGPVPLRDWLPLVLQCAEGVSAVRKKVGRVRTPDGGKDPPP